MWERSFSELLPGIRRHVPEGSRVLEVGYGDGVLSCWLVRELGWRIIGLDISGECRMKAMVHAKTFGLADCVEFECCLAEETWAHEGQYDAVFIKTVLYNAPDLRTYGKWLNWVLSVLRPRGIFVNFETGRAGRLARLNRILRRREYRDYLLYSEEIEPLYDERFEIIERRYYGGWSQFLAPAPALYRTAAKVEEWIAPRNARNCFIVGMVCKKC